jgi:hypothetical protein
MVEKDTTGSMKLGDVCVYCIDVMDRPLDRPW